MRSPHTQTHYACQNATPPSSAIKHYKSLSYETLAASWLVNDGWDVFMPMIDHGQKTDIVISDGFEFYRIQIKSVETNDECFEIENK